MKDDHDLTTREGGTSGSAGVGCLAFLAAALLLYLAIWFGGCC
jgi:hypothetical protein